MKMTLTFLSFSGAPADFASVERFFEAQAAAGHRIFTATDHSATDGGDAPNEQETDMGAGGGPPEEAFLSLIQRVSLSPEYRSYIRYVYEAGDGGITIPEIASKTGQPENRVKAALRNFGKRAAHTPEWPKGMEFFRRQWQSTQNRYWLHPAMRQAIDDGRIDI
jgi:hypothetical protein